MRFVGARETKCGHPCVNLLRSSWRLGGYAEVSLNAHVTLPAAVLPDESWSDRLWAGVGAAIDSAAGEAARRVIGAVLAARTDDLTTLRAAAAPYLTTALRERPRAFFAFLDAPAEIVEPRTVTHRRRDGGAVIRRRFANPSQPYDRRLPAAADDILIEHWQHERRAPRATVLAVHGFGMGTPRLDAWALFAEAWYGRGLDVALLTLPHHGARAAGARFSGQGFADPSPARVHENVRQAVHELHVVRAWLRATSDRPVGLLGLSLGGYLSALTAGLVDDLDFVVPMVPPVCFGELAWRMAGDRRPSSADRDRAELRALFRLHSPLAFPLRIDRQRALIVAGRGDRIVPPEHPHALWEHWDRPVIHWFGGSHLAPFGRRGIVAAVDAHLRRLGIL